MSVICPVMVGTFKHSTCHMLLCKFFLRLNAGEQSNSYSQRYISDDCKHLVIKEVGPLLPLCFSTEGWEVSLHQNHQGGLVPLPRDIQSFEVDEPLTSYVLSQNANMTELNRIEM